MVRHRRQLALAEDLSTAREGPALAAKAVEHTRQRHCLTVSDTVTLSFFLVAAAVAAAAGAAAALLASGFFLLGLRRRTALAVALSATGAGISLASASCLSCWSLSGANIVMPATASVVSVKCFWHRSSTTSVSTTAQPCMPSHPRIEKPIAARNVGRRGWTWRSSIGEPFDEAVPIIGT